MEINFGSFRFLREDEGPHRHECERGNRHDEAELAIEGNTPPQIKDLNRAALIA